MVSKPSWENNKNRSPPGTLVDLSSRRTYSLVSLFWRPFSAFWWTFLFVVLLSTSPWTFLLVTHLPTTLLRLSSEFYGHCRQPPSQLRLPFRPLTTGSGAPRADLPRSGHHMSIKALTHPHRLLFWRAIFSQTGPIPSACQCMQPPFLAWFLCHGHPLILPLSLQFQLHQSWFDGTSLFLVHDSARLAVVSTALFDMVVAPTSCSYPQSFIPIRTRLSPTATCHLFSSEVLQSPILPLPFSACFPATAFSLLLIFQQRTFWLPIISLSFSGVFLGEFYRFAGYLWQHTSCAFISVLSLIPERALHLPNKFILNNLKHST